MTDDQLYASNYAVAFVDLLGQREEMRQYRILPDDKAKAMRVIKDSVGKIVGMHDLFKRFYDSFEATSTFFDNLPSELKAQLPSMNRGELRTQRFSDGLVLYASLAEIPNQSPINSLYGLLSAAGSLVLIHLAGKSPLRVGIEIGWGVELRPGELYGAALAHAYELESQVAQWPRVVVGKDLVDYLEVSSNSEENSINDKYRRAMAQVCLSYLAEDLDGSTIVDFAGPTFLKNASEVQHRETLAKAKHYVDEQLEKWSAQGNASLAGRYQCLRHYLNTRAL